MRLSMIPALLTILVPAAFAQQQPPPPPLPPTVVDVDPGVTRCYVERTGLAQRCFPEFVNAAFSRQIEATNVCGGGGPSVFCVQTGHSGHYGDIDKCDVCDAGDPQRSHPAAALTDLHERNTTWWQSETMFDGVQYPNSVNLTLRLGKTFEITYVRLNFHGPRPESFAIYKKSHANSSWVLWQLFSQSCRSTYGVPMKAPILPGAEDAAQCTDEYSGISPLSGADVVFSALEERPSAHNFQESPVLQEWVTATDIMIVLNRLNTFGDEPYGDENVLRSYYYAIADLAVGGRCKCNGHASECVKSTGGGVEALVCRCEHNTAGSDCEQCKEGFHQRPWRRATLSNVNECLPCDCNGMSQRCYFDADMFESGGDGGHCIDCAGNTRGAHCDVCLEGHWRRPRENHCIPCNCNAEGSVSLQCDTDGQCECKPGVTGQFCDRCKDGFYQFSMQGCKDCHCERAGSVGNEGRCDGESGRCACKANVEGEQCDRCRPGYFDLSLDNDFGCTPCFCYGHSSKCESAPGYYRRNVTAHFDQGTEMWTATFDGRPISVQHSEPDTAVAATHPRATEATTPRDSGVYFGAPSAFLGDVRAAYNHELQFEAHVVSRTAHPTDAREMVVLTGANGRSLTIQTTMQNNPVPSSIVQTFRYRLHEDSQFGWNPRLNNMEFLSILANVTEFKIRGTYNVDDVGFLSEVSLESASRSPNGGGGDGEAEPALFVEHCDCLEGFLGQFCESCAPGSRRDNKFGGPFDRCVDCDCNGHGHLCDAESGRCICLHNTTGDNCQRCAHGFYTEEQTLKGEMDDCKPCPCPTGASCSYEPRDQDTYCHGCPDGRNGRRCEKCLDGWFGQPADGTPCNECECNGNIDKNNVRNCDGMTGQCLRCTEPTSGYYCENCMPGYWGDATSTEGRPGEKCLSCDCVTHGTVKPSADFDTLNCSQRDGQCQCLPKVVGQKCGDCEPGYFNLTSGTGCQACNCDPTGSLNSTCNIGSGQCQCKEGVTGLRCDQCEQRRFGFGEEGCEHCECEPMGSESDVCDVATGQCQCRDNVESRRCDKCMENMYDLRAGCLKCDECYSLVQKRVNMYRDDLAELRTLLNEIIENPVTVNDTDFDNRLEEVKLMVDELEKTVKDGLADDDTSLVAQVEELKQKLNEARELLAKVDQIMSDINSSTEETDTILQQFDRSKERAQMSLNQAESYLQTEGRDAWDRAEEASKKYGVQSEELKNISKESRQLADEQEATAERIEQLAAEARNASELANTKANDAIFGVDQSDNVDKLQEDFELAEREYNKTLSSATSTSEMAARVNREAAETLAAVNELTQPAVDVNATVARANELQDDAASAKQNVDEIVEANRLVEDEAARVASVAQAEFERARGIQQSLDEVLAKVDAARARAVEALKMAEDTLAQAQNTLETLQEFDERVESSKAEALEQMEAVPTIERLITEAENQTRRAEDALGDASADAAEAEDIAARAQREAEAASTKATEIREEATQTKESAVRTKEDVAALQEDVDDKRATLANYDAQAEQDALKTAQALAAASQAELAAERTNKTVADALNTVKEILDQLTCDCNGMSQRCYFDADMFETGGDGGHCIDCSGNTRGAHCDVCLEGHWRRPRENHCIPCNCNAEGSVSLQCDADGQCECKPGVTGQFCDRCKDGFYQFSMQGCKDCHCERAGSVGNEGRCDGESGRCACKANVEGEQCDRCRPGYFDLSLDNDFGCTPCFCYGHSSKCESAPGYYRRNVTAHFDQGTEMWTATFDGRPISVQHSEPDAAVAATHPRATEATAPRDSGVYFGAPSAFLGDVRAAYNHELQFEAHVVSRTDAREMVVLTGANGRSLTIQTTMQNNPVPSSIVQTFRYRLHEDSQFGWNPRLNNMEFLSILANVTEFKIRGTYNVDDVGFLSEVSLESASRSPNGGGGDGEAEPALFVEHCDCLEGFLGQFCESCAPGSRRDNKFGGPFDRCVDCDCNGHGHLCDAESGRCICLHNTTGDNCQRCAHGFYTEEQTLKGEMDDCKPCPCPTGASCSYEPRDQDTYCHGCPDGRNGRRCEKCLDGWFGQPADGTPCNECECNGNIDKNNVRNCDGMTGQCLRCTEPTTGYYCENCMPGYWGDATSTEGRPGEKCLSCDCVTHGTVKPSADFDTLNCSQRDGQCQCLPKVLGQKCADCEPGYFNLTSGTGCQACNCDPTGSLNSTCNIGSGQCQCKEGVTGLRCDQCEQRRFGFGEEGCEHCECEPMGSESDVCDVATGQCQCRDNVESRRCDKCMENMYDLRAGCLKCDECYSLVQKRVNMYRDDLAELRTLLNEIIENPVTVNDTDFDNRLEEVKLMVDELEKTVKDGLADDDTSLVAQVEELKQKLNEARELLAEVDQIMSDINSSTEETDTILQQFDRSKERAQMSLNQAESYLQTEGRDAWDRAEEASKKYGVQSEELKNISKESRELADEQEATAERIEQLAAEARNASELANTKANDAIFGVDQSDNVDKLQQDFELAEREYNKTLSSATSTSEMAARVNREAAETLAAVNELTQPAVDVNATVARTNELQDDAASAKQNVDEIVEANRLVEDEAARVASVAQAEFERARGIQQSLDEVLAKVDAARARAVEALKMAEDTLAQAQNTLETLQEFDERVESSKAEALEQMEAVPTIERLITEAENQTRRAEDALGDASADAAEAEDIAARAQREAEAASTKATEIREEATQTKESAVRTKEDVAALQQDVDDKRATLANYDAQAEQDALKTAQALAAASQAELAAERTNKTVADALNTVKEILDQLKSLEGVEDVDLDELEAQLDEAEAALQEANLEKEVTALKDQQNEQQRKINQYKTDIDKLTKDVENIEQIRDSLPDKCFNVVKLEGTRR